MYPGLPKGDYNGIYIKKDSSKAVGMWIASPSYPIDDGYVRTEKLITVSTRNLAPSIINEDTSGLLGISTEVAPSGSGSGTGIRPIVCLKSSTKLQKQANGNYRIIGDMPNDEVKSHYYGSIVENYTVPGVDTWRIFHDDGQNIYLIADDYVHKDYIPSTPNYSVNTFGSNENYKVSFTNIIKDYSGAVDMVSSISKVSEKWLSKYMEYNSTSKNDNAKATAYLLDTNLWSNFANGYAEYAIGAPTIEMFCASYKKTHPYRYLEYMIGGGDEAHNKEPYLSGYNVKWNDEAWDGSKYLSVSRFTKR